MATQIGKPGYELTPKMKKALELVMEPGFNRTISGICEGVGVSRNAVYKWLKPGHPFRIAWDHLPTQMMSKRLPFIVSALSQKAEAGDVQAIKLCFDYMGLLVQKHEIVQVNVNETSLADKLNSIIIDAEYTEVEATPIRKENAGNGNLLPEPQP